jgi:large subunit ribosomal protein L35
VSYWRFGMPKMKTHSGAKKRFRLTAKGKVRGRHAFTSHKLEIKSPKHKRALGRPVAISAHDTPRVKKLLGVGAKGAPSASGAPGSAGSTRSGDRA